MPSSKFTFLGKFIFTLIFIACEAPKKPQFLYLEDIRISEITFSSITIEGDAIFYNPNSFSLELVETDIQLSIGKSHIGKVLMAESISIKGEQNFSIPLKIDIPTKNIVDSMGNLSSLILKQEVDLHFRGWIKVQVKGFNFKIPIRQSKTVSLTE